MRKTLNTKITKSSHPLPSKSDHEDAAHCEAFTEEEFEKRLEKTLSLDLKLLVERLGDKDFS
ncbi:MAG: hypothetical protein K9K67_03540 [Bacteriovoracaceae bacterium]|nr:hypothetical protein [Bacteriovoracaceae bacterium]